MAQNVNRCFQCKSILKKTAKFAKCGLCQNDFHFTCTAIIQEKYNFIQNNGGQWYCEGCSRCAGKVLQRLQTLEETQIKMQDYCKELEEKLESATQKIVDLESQLEVVVKTTNQKFEEQINQVPQPRSNQPPSKVTNVKEKQVPHFQKKPPKMILERELQ